MKEERKSTPKVTLSVEEYALFLEQENKMKALREEVLLNEVELSSLRQENDSLRWLLLDLQRRQWGKSSERQPRILPEDPAQLKILWESPVDVASAEDEKKQAKEKAEKTEKEYSRYRKTFSKPVKPHARKPIPEHFRREDVKVPVPEHIDLAGAIKIGQEVTEQYALAPAQLYVIRITREKYRLSDGSIYIPELPVLAHPRSNASASILSHLAVAKYADHLPIHRQLEIFRREGVTLSPSTVSNWMAAAAQRLEPVYNEIREQVKSSYYVQADETPHPVLENDKPGSLHRGYMWAYYLPQQHIPFFQYRPGRGKDGADLLIDGKVEVVQSDGYAVYDIFDKLPDRLHLCCWAHVRRKFFESRTSDPPRAQIALRMIGELYHIEEEIKSKNLAPEDTVRLRSEKAYPIIKELETWCKAEYLKTPDKSPIAKAMEYMYVRFEQLSAYVRDARLQIDNNPVERSIRPLTLNRKNVLFSGSHEAAHHAAIFFTLLGCCKENNVNPKEWMEDVLIKVQLPQYTQENNFAPLTPLNWKKQKEGID